MAKANFVKAARKDNPVAKKGESYWWWKPMVGGRGGAKRFSKERPRRSQLTQSEFLSSLYDLEDGDMQSVATAEDFTSIAEALRELGQAQQEKLDNMPDGLRDGDTGQMLEERASGCDSWADEIDARGSELESALEAAEAVWEAWQEFDRAEEEYDDNDPEAEEPEEPDEDRPEGDSLDAVKEAIADEHRDVFGNNPF